MSCVCSVIQSSAGARHFRCNETNAFYQRTYLFFTGNYFPVRSLMFCVIEGIWRQQRQTRRPLSLLDFAIRRPLCSLPSDRVASTHQHASWASWVSVPRYFHASCISQHRQSFGGVPVSGPPSNCSVHGVGAVYPHLLTTEPTWID